MSSDEFNTEEPFDDSRSSVQFSDLDESVGSELLNLKAEKCLVYYFTSSEGKKINFHKINSPIYVFHILLDEIVIIKI